MKWSNWKFNCEDKYDGINSSLHELCYFQCAYFRRGGDSVNRLLTSRSVASSRGHGKSNREAKRSSCPLLHKKAFCEDVNKTNQETFLP